MEEHSSEPARPVLRQSSRGGCVALEAGGRPAPAAAFVLNINASHFVLQHTFDCCLLHFYALCRLYISHFVHTLCCEQLAGVL